MNIENVKALAEILSSYGLASIEVNEGENRIRIEKGASPQTMRAKSAADEPSVPDLEANADVNAPSVDFNSLIEVKSPMIGVFYSAASPESETFVSIGSKVKKGDVLCLIETMKLMNEITAAQDGEIVDICVKNGDIAEYGQVLFKMY